MKNGNKPKILIVDDAPNNLVALQAVFSGLNYQLVEANSGAEALALMVAHDDIALVLLDVQMPEMDGFETAIKMKKLAGYRDIPIIFITAIYREDPFVRRGYESGAIDYFGKPFDPEILKMKVAIYVSHREKELLLKEREKRIRETEELLQTGRKLSSILESLPVGVLIADSEGRICQTNDEVSRILKSMDATTNDNYGELLGWWDENGQLLKDSKGPLIRALTGVSTHNEMLKITCLDGTHKTINCSASPLMGLNNQIMGAGIIIQDVTESKKIEEDLENRIMKLISLGVEFEQSTPH